MSQDGHPQEMVVSIYMESTQHLPVIHNSSANIFVSSTRQTICPDLGRPFLHWGRSVDALILESVLLIIFKQLHINNYIILQGQLHFSGTCTALHEKVSRATTTHPWPFQWDICSWEQSLRFLTHLTFYTFDSVTLGCWTPKLNMFSLIHSQKGYWDLIYGVFCTVAIKFL